MTFFLIALGLLVLFSIALLSRDARRVLAIVTLTCMALLGGYILLMRHMTSAREAENRQQDRERAIEQDAWDRQHAQAKCSSEDTYGTIGDNPYDTTPSGRPCPRAPRPQ
jgi:hypothetical protein